MTLSIFSVFVIILFVVGGFNLSQKPTVEGQKLVKRTAPFVGKPGGCLS